MPITNLGAAYGKSGMPEEEIESYRHALRINPDDADVHYNLGVVFIGAGMHKEAIESFQEAVRINPDDADAHSALEQYKTLKGLNPELANELFHPINE